MAVLRHVNFELPPDELLSPGHMGCAGCGAALAMRLALKALGRKTVLVIPSCCWSVIDGPAPHTAVGVPVMHTPAGSAVPAAAGVRAALDLQGDDDTSVCAWTGDAGAVENGIQGLSAAAERNENILYVCYDTEARLTGQRRTDLIAVAAALRIPYAATATVAFPEDLAAKVARTRLIKGTKFLHILVPCPPGWQIATDRAIKVARLAVLSRAFPLVEVENGSWRITLDPGRVPLEDYLKEQGRYESLLTQPEAVAAARAAIDERWQQIINRTGRPMCG